MTKRTIYRFILVIMILLGVSGVVLYLASYFFGLVFIFSAVILWYIARYIVTDAATIRVEIRDFFKHLIIPVIGIVVAVLVGGILLAITGNDPVAAYKALFYGGFVKNWHISVLNAVPLIFTGLSIAFAFKAGLFNIGAEGQYYVGAMVATWLGIYFKFPPLLSVLSIVLIFIISGALAASYNAIPALLKVKTGAHEVITTMMFAHIARHMSSLFIRHTGGDSAGPHPYVSDPIHETNELPFFKDFLPQANYRLHIGILIAIVMALLVWWLLYRTRWGFEIRAIGQNQSAARAAGISVGGNIFKALIFSGFLAGLAGVVQVVGLDHKLFENLDAGYGWNGIAVALLASNSPIGVIFAALLWGALDAGGQYMVRTQQISNAIVEIIKAMVLFLVVANYIYSHLGNRIKKRKKRYVKEVA